MDYLMGIDGGGSTVRAVIVTNDLQVAGESKGPTANPNLVGRPTALKTIQTAMTDAITEAGIPVQAIRAVGIGVAGAEASHSEAWLRKVVSGVTPDAYIAPSGDHEIALVGAHGAHRGILVLAGTGSLACGVGSAGEYHVIGARGYLLGDEGSGYWIGKEGLIAAIRDDDGRGRHTQLTAALLEKLQLANVEALIPWMYHSGVSRTKEVAALAGTVLETAEQGDRVALEIVWKAADELALAIRAVNYRLNMEQLPVAFAGGLLSFMNPLSRALCNLIRLTEIPLPKYSAAIGGAILAQSALARSGLTGGKRGA